jgi:two-component system, chemotaxis family, chemotaxis protein CheY
VRVSAPFDSLGSPSQLEGGREFVRPTAPHDESGNGRVPIVDDDAAIRTVCAISLQAEGLSVLEAVDGLRGLEQARRQRPDLVLTDVRMAGLDGFQLAYALRADRRTRSIPLIFLSAETGKANAERARALVWLIVASAVLGWLLGIVTSVVFRLRTRRRRIPAGRADTSGG